jgi:hypothetical protein
MKNKTALEEFAIALYEGGYLQGNGDEIQNLLEQAKEMDKKQIEEAFINGHKDGWKFGIGETQQFFLSEIYYNETYGGNK